MDFIIRDEPVIDSEGKFKHKTAEESEYERLLDEAIENIKEREKTSEENPKEETPKEQNQNVRQDADASSVLAKMSPWMAQLYLFLDLAQRMGLKLGTEKPSKGGDEELLDRLIDFGKMLGLVLQGMSKPLSDMEEHIYKRESVMLDNLLKREELLWKLQKRRSGEEEKRKPEGEQHLGKGHLHQE